MDQHVIIDAINKAFDDRVSRLFAELDADPTAENVVKFGDGMAKAWQSRSMALAEIRRRMVKTMQPIMSMQPAEIGVVA
jgi:hypothetical protein